MRLIRMMNLTRIDLPSLRCFAVLMEEQSVSRAADRLDLSQPAMSHALQRLRQLFDDPLLVRTQGRMAPTSRALKLLPAIRDILAGVEGLQAAEEDFNPKTARVRFVMTATEYLEFALAPRLILRLQQEAPGIDIEIRTPNHEFVRSWLENGTIDFRLGWVCNPPRMLRSRLLFQDRLVVLARQDHPTAHGRLTLSQYLELPHVRCQAGGRTSSGRVIDAAVSSHKKRLRISLLIQNYLTIPYAVAQSNMIATVPERLATSFARQLPLQILELPFRAPRQKFSVYWHERTHRDPRHRWFRQVLADVGRSL